MASLFLEDNDVADSKGETGQVDFFQQMTGWTDTSSVGSQRSTSPKSDEFNISNFLMGGPSEGLNIASPFGKIVSDKTDDTDGACMSVMPSTRTSKKVVICQNLMTKYVTHDASALLTAIIDSEDPEDLETYRVLKTTPQFAVIWDQAVNEIQALQRKNGVTYVDQFINTASACDLNTMPVPDTALFWLEWCKHQRIDPAIMLIEIYAVLSHAYPKRNCFALIGASDAGKTFWMGAIASLTDQRGDTITSGDFMWQECVDKALIYIPELVLTKPDQVESFKKVCEGQQTNINVKNKRAAVLNRTPVILTSNSPPWSFFTNEEIPIRNRMFIHNVRAFNDWQPNQGAPNTAFFVEMFKLIKKCVANDNEWPYDLTGERVHVLQDIVETKLGLLARAVHPAFVLKPEGFDEENPVTMDRKWALSSLNDATLEELRGCNSKELCMNVRYLIASNCDTPYFSQLPGTHGIELVPDSWKAFMASEPKAYRARVTRATYILEEVRDLMFRFPNVLTNQPGLDAQYYVKAFIQQMLSTLAEFIETHWSAKSKQSKKRVRVSDVGEYVEVTTSAYSPSQSPPLVLADKPTCYGCDNDCLSQRDHMGQDGCMGDGGVTSWV